MASVESIGACSLDFETSVSDNFLTKDLTTSECMLQSTSVTPSMKESMRNRDVSKDVTNNGVLPADEQRTSNGISHLANGVKQGSKQECTVAEIKLPSYVSISCAINGYTNYSRFCRSRDNSPARSSFRKSSFEPSMLSEINSKELNSLPFDDMRSNYRCARSQSDTNGTMHSVFTESRHVTVSKQLRIPLKSTKKYTTEIIIDDGQHSSVETTLNTSGNVIINGHTTENHALAKEVGIDGAKSLVQQRIESLYGKSVCDEMKISNLKTSVKQKDIHYVNGNVKNITSKSPTPPGKNHIGGTSPPVFRHLTKDFRRQLQGSTNDDMKFDFHHEPSLIKTIKKPQISAEETPVAMHNQTNGFSTVVTNGVSSDECDKIASIAQPIVSNVSREGNKYFMKDTSAVIDSEKTGSKFLELVDLEKEKIQVQIKIMEGELLKNRDIPEEASGKIRVACGKANLLLTQKFEQFRGLCRKNMEENPDVPFYTTASDLAGFWDLVMLQVDDINSTFKEIEAMKENNWKEVISKKAVVCETRARKSTSGAISKSNPCTPKRSAKSAELARAREESRRQLLAAKKKGRQQNTSSDDVDVAIFTPASSS